MNMLSKKITIILAGIIFPCTALFAQTTSSSQHPIIGGITFDNCGADESRKILSATELLVDEFVNNFHRFERCLSSAELVEKRGRTGGQIAKLYTKNKVTHVRCENLSSSFNAEARVNIKDQKMKVDHNFLNSNSVRRVASVMTHELAHNFGFRHSVNDFGSLLYSLTVPEQAEACILNGAPNAAPNSSWVKLWDDTNFKDRELTIKFKQSYPSFSNIRSDNGKKGFNDKTSAAQWKIPRGWKAVLYEHGNYRGRTLNLIGTGRIEEMPSMKSKGFNDKTTSIKWERVR